MASAEALAAAYAACARLARAHYENFPVASLLLPRAMRPHVAAVYAFARGADDVADEGTRSPEQRNRLLDDWLTRLRARIHHGDHGDHGESRHGEHGEAHHRDHGGHGEISKRSSSVISVPPVVDSSVVPVPPVVKASSDQIFLALGHTIREKRLPLSLFEDLISAFRQDITVRRYATWHELLDYCRRSANPVGRLVLRIAGYDDQALDRASDALCSALQLANFWQDLERDWQKGRLYVPLADVEACEARDADLDRRRLTPEWRAALERVSARTRALFDEGRRVPDGVRGRLRWELRLTWLGGVRILDRLERTGFDVFRERPTLGPADAPVIVWRALAWR